MLTLSFALIVLLSSYIGVPPLFLCKIFKVDNLGLDLRCNPVAT